MNHAPKYEATDAMAARRITAALVACLLTLTLLLAPPAATAQSTGETFVLNLRDTEINVLAEQVSMITERTLVLDPALGGKVTVISTQELDSDGIWALFQSILRSRGYVAVQTDSIWEVVPEAEARTRGNDGVAVLPGSQDFVTRLLRLDRLPSEEAVRVLSPLVAASGYIEAVTDPNAIVITDTNANVERLFEIARTFDADSGTRTEVIRFRFAQAPIVGAAISEVLGDAGTQARLSVDGDSNTLLVRGSAAEIEMIRGLAGNMDIAPRAMASENISTIIYRLNYADAETVAEIVTGTLRGGADLTNPVAEAIGPDGEPVRMAPSLIASEVAVTASTETNAVIVRGNPRQLDEVRTLIAALDIQRPQVMIEAAIVEVSGEVADRIGVQLGFGPNIPNGAISATSFGNSGPSLQNVLVALGASGGSALSTGLTVGVGGDDFGALIQALSQSTRANLLSTPSVTTLDNRPATIVVGQNVPFRTGSFATDGNTLTPFTTIERRDVGITMEVLPRVTAGGIVRLEISQEVSSLVNANVAGAADLVTNRRVINTTVEAMNGGTIVLGGLITDDRLQTEGKVPGLGDIPIVGNLFRSRSRDATRRTLFVFLRPRIITNQHQAQAVADGRLGRLRQAEGTTPTAPSLATRGGNQPVPKLPLEINGLY